MEMPKYAVICFGERIGEVLKARVIDASSREEAVEKFEEEYGKRGYSVAFSIE